MPQPKRLRGFSLIELLVVVVIIGILASLLLPVFSKAKGKGMGAICLSNLKQIGIYKNMYLGDHKDEFPFGMARWADNIALTWDDLLHGYMGGPSSYKSLVEWEPQLGQGGGTNVNDRPEGVKVLKCPSDKLPNGDANFPLARRSYAMPRHSTDLVSAAWGNVAIWPPSKSNRCGLGLEWPDAFTTPRPHRSWSRSDPWTSLIGLTNIFPRFAPAVFGSMITGPSDTIFLTEQPRCNPGAGMQQGSQAYQTIFSADAHFNHTHGSSDYTDTKLYHSSSANYLFVDGHVEAKLPEMTLGRTNQNLAVQSGMWTIVGSD